MTTGPTEGEVWKSCSIDSRYRVSSLGRAVGPNGHLLTAAPNVSTGYPQISIGGTKYNLHVLICEAFHGPRPPEGVWWALHRDDTKTNNKPDNLYWGTPRSNAADSMQNGNDFAFRAKLNWAQVREIRLRVSRGELPTRIKDDYGISQPAMMNIVHKRTWKE